MSADAWMTHMHRGDFAAAWKINDARMAERRAAGSPTCWHWPRHLQYVWNGEPLEGRRVLVRCYHGLGDTVQFIRYAPLLKAIAAEVIVWAQPSLVPLVQTVRGVDRVLPLHDGAPEAEFDVDVEIMELPHVFRSVVGTLPAEVPYLHVAPAVSGPIRATRAAGKRAVGLVWRAGDWDERRSVPGTLLAAVLSGVPGVDWYLLQRGAATGAMPKGFAVDVSSDDAAEAARTMRALDLVISVDSFPAHLAGALGVPVWTLLHTGADWRWMDGPRADSPWYPTMRLFRQSPEQPGDWRPVLEHIVGRLSERASPEQAARCFQL